MTNDSPQENRRSAAPAVMVNIAGLEPLRARENLPAYVTSLWKTRFFIARDAKARSMSEGRGMLLGYAWVFLNPAIQVGLYAFIFGLILKTNRGVDNFIGFLIIGVTFFGFVSAGLNAGALVIQRNRGLLNSFNFPKAAVPISTGLRLFYDNAPAAILAVVFALLSQHGKPPSWTVLLVLPVYLLLHLFIVGIILIVARITAFIPDFRSLIQVVTRILFFTSGVFWPIEHFVHDEALASILKFNPFYQFLNCVRTLVLDGDFPSMLTLSSVVIWPLATFLVGLIYFWGEEHRYAGVK
ncbi:ABC transporter permease [Corynebacterium sp. LK2510]|uniref:ABC transporter permease n=1 Tax=Corynebacterium sp. LK2510 TaxID=3110472 RepID=UPI0034CF5489